MIHFTPAQLKERQQQQQQSQQQKQNDEPLVNLDDPNYQPPIEQQQQQQQQDGNNDIVDNNEEDNKLQEFWYLEPAEQTLYIDTAPVSKGASPTALPIPQQFTNGKLKGMPNYRLFITGSIYDRGIEVCRVIV
eukprot:UN04439